MDKIKIIIVVGGVAGGAAFAARARRLDENARIIILERGEYISFANCGLPYYVGGTINNRQALIIQNPESFRKRFNIDVRVMHEAVSIDRQKRTVRVKDIARNNEYTLEYDTLLLSPGAEPIIPPIEGAKQPFVYSIRTIPDIDSVKNALKKGGVKTAVVVGAGFIGIEMAENLVELGIHIHLIERLNQVMPLFDPEMAVILQRELAGRGVELHLGETLTRITEKGVGCTAETQSGKNIEADMVIMAVGVKPEIQLAKNAGLELGIKGIKVNSKMQTSDPSIYAIGDAVEVVDPITNQPAHIPLAGPAAKQALTAANNISGIESEYKGTYGTSIVKVFSLAAASAGASEKTLIKFNIPYEKIYTFPWSHAGYYPGAAQLSFKLLFNTKTGLVLGAQIIGREGVDRRIDLISVCLKHRLTVYDMAEFELSYAPPYGSAKDAVNLAGMTAANHLRGLSKITHWGMLTGKEVIVDVRSEDESVEEPIPNTKNIPIDSLRERLNELPRDKQIAVLCGVGIRAHSAVRILTQNGFNTVNISGGYLAYKNFIDSKQEVK